MRAFASAPTASPKPRAATVRSSAAPRVEMAVRPNRTGMPDTLKSGIEALSGLSMDIVKVHYNSSLPAPLAARAVAQGTDIHLAPGQEGTLPHEAWHVVQPAQGRVRPTTQLGGGVTLNDDEGLEREADRMGAMALRETGIRALERGVTGGAAVGVEAAQRTDVGAMPEERHLPHEAWHVVQQKRRRVPATGYLGSTPLNADPTLEREADARGGHAEAYGATGPTPIGPPGGTIDGGAPAAFAGGWLKPASPPVQLMKFNKNGSSAWTFLTAYFDTDNLEEFQTRVEAYAKERKVDELQKILDKLTASPEDKNCSIAASAVRWYLTEYIGEGHRKDLWKYFIDEKEYAGKNIDTREAALAFDRQESPGYYNMMQNIFESEILDESKKRKKVDFDVYDEYHRRLTQGVMARAKDGGFDFVPHALSERSVQYPVTTSGDPDPDALVELVNEGIAGLGSDQLAKLTDAAFKNGVELLQRYDLAAILPSIGPLVSKQMELAAAKRALTARHDLGPGEKRAVIELGYFRSQASTFSRAAEATYRKIEDEPDVRFASRFKKYEVQSDGTTQWLATTDRDKADAKPLVDRILSKMYDEIRDAGAERHGKIVAICKALRALHVAHIYVDANGRLNTMLLLNKLLAEIDLGPISLADTSVFGGRMTLAHLAQLVEAKLPPEQAQGVVSAEEEKNDSLIDEVV